MAKQQPRAHVRTWVRDQQYAQAIGQREGAVGTRIGWRLLNYPLLVIVTHNYEVNAFFMHGQYPFLTTYRRWLARISERKDLCPP